MFDYARGSAKFQLSLAYGLRRVQRRSGHLPELRRVVLSWPCHHAIFHFGYFVGIHKPTAAHLHDLEDVPALRGELPKLRFVGGLSLSCYDVEILLGDLVCIDIPRVLACSLLYGKQSVKGVDACSLGGSDPSRIISGGRGGAARHNVPVAAVLAD